MTDTRRAEFDKWCRDNRWTPTESMWAAWEACSMRYDAATAGQGGEWVMVPREPTAAMREAGKWEMSSACEDVYAAMLAAAPPVQVKGEAVMWAKKPSDLGRGPEYYNAISSQTRAGCMADSSTTYGFDIPLYLAQPAARQDEGRDAARYRHIKADTSLAWICLMRREPDEWDAEIDAAMSGGG